MNFAAPHEDLGFEHIYTIRDNLNRMFGKDTWFNYELETFTMEFGCVLDDLTKDKLSLVQILELHPDLFFNDVLFFLHAVNVINNNIAEFNTFPLPSSLELAFANSEVHRLFPSQAMEYSKGILKTIAYILTLEGYSEPVYPFNEMGIKTEYLAKGQELVDTKNKEKAIQLYIKAMNDLSNTRLSS